VAVGLLAIGVAGCNARNKPAQEDLSFPKRIAVPPCEQPGSRVEVLDVRPDPFRWKPSPGLEHIVVDLHVHARYAQDLWLLVDETTFPSGVRSVSKSEDGWLFNNLVHAWWLGRSADVTFKDLHLTTSDPTIPVVLGQINVENVSPQTWLERGGLGDHRDTYGGALVYAGIEVECVSWLDVTPRTPR